MMRFFHLPGSSYSLRFWSVSALYTDQKSVNIPLCCCCLFTSIHILLVLGVHYFMVPGCGIKTGRSIQLIFRGVPSKHKMKTIWTALIMHVPIWYWFKKKKKKSVKDDLGKKKVLCTFQDNTVSLKTLQTRKQNCNVKIGRITFV